MRKVMLLAAMLAMALAAAAPALAQQGDVNLGDDQINVGDDVQYQAVCQNVFDEINASGVQYAGSFNEQEAEAETEGAGDDPATAAVSQDVAAELGVSVEVVNECLNNFATVSAAAATHSATAKSAATSTSTSTATATATASASAASASALPPTGGPAAPSSLLALGAGTLLVAGGLLARRIVR